MNFLFFSLKLLEKKMEEYSEIILLIHFRLIGVHI